MITRRSFCLGSSAMDNLRSESLSDFIVWDCFWELGGARGSSSGYLKVRRLTFRLEILSKRSCSHEFSAREVRQDWTAEKNVKPLYSPDDDMPPGEFRRTINSVSVKFQRSLESGSERIKKSWKSYSIDSVVANSFGSGLLDPQGPFLQKWNKIFVLACIIAVSLDPLFFYIPVIDDKKKCLGLDRKMEITASVLRSFTDIFYIVHIIFRFRTGFIAPSSRVFGRGVLVEDAWAIARMYPSSYFLIDILAVLPLP